MLWLISLSQVSEIQQLVGEKAKHYESEIEEFSKNHDLCQECNIDLFLENHEEICSVLDVFNQELSCVEEITYYGYILSEVTLPRYVNAIITLLTKKAKTGPILKKRVKLYQRISSMILYFMQFIPEYRKSTMCMRFIILLADKSVKMSI
jgi:ribosomal protein S27AE